MWAYLRNVGRKNGKENSRPIRCNRWKTQKGRPLREWLDDVVEYVEYVYVGKRKSGNCARKGQKPRELCRTGEYNGRATVNIYTGSVPTELEEEGG